MRLTRKIAIEKCKELWKWCTRTGKDKSLWPKWKENEKYARPAGTGILNHCWFCEYGHQNGERSGIKDVSFVRMCTACPYYQKYGSCHDHGLSDTIYNKWNRAETVSDRRKYAKLFYAQIKTLK